MAVIASLKSFSHVVALALIFRPLRLGIWLGADLGVHV